jgi:hypothetical protein
VVEVVGSVVRLFSAEAAESGWLAFQVGAFRVGEGFFILTALRGAESAAPTRSSSKVPDRFNDCVVKSWAD